MKIKLVSFAICPYVQRAAITLKYKNVPFDIEYIDLANKPEWFLKLSPLGKVPILVINDSDVIFESAVINELLDELILPSTLSKDPIAKAKERAWIAFADSLFTDLRELTFGKELKEVKEAIINKLTRLEAVISDAGFFKKEGFSIIDSSYAPLFMRMQYIEGLTDGKAFRSNEKVVKWYQNLLSQDYVKQSVREDFETLFRGFMQKKNPNLALTPRACVI